MLSCSGSTTLMLKFPLFLPVRPFKRQFYSYQDIDPEDPVAIISQIIMNRERHSCQYSLSDYFLDNRRLYHHGKLYLFNQKSLYFRILQESHDQPMTRHLGVARTYEIL